MPLIVCISNQHSNRLDVSEESLKAIAVCKECMEKEASTSLMQHVCVVRKDVIL